MYSEAVAWALEQPGIYETTLPASQIAVSRESILDLIFAAEKVPQTEYVQLVQYLQESRSAHNLGKEYEFFPPAVPFSRKGLYYMRVSFPSQEEIDANIRALFDDDKMERQRSHYQPLEFITAWEMLLLLSRLRDDNYPSYIDEAMKDHYTLHIIPSMEREGWTHNERAGQFERAAQINYTERRKCREFLNGAHAMRLPNFYDIVSTDAYDNIYTIQTKDWPAAFIDHAAEIATEFGYVIEGANANPIPINMPDNIKELGFQIVGNRDNIITTADGSHDHLMFSTIAEKLFDADFHITHAQIEAQLLGRQGAWRTPLIKTGFRLVSGTEYKTAFSDDLNLTEHSFRTIAKLRSNLRTSTDKVDFALGFPVTARGLCIDSTGQLIYLNVVGSYNAIKANWAALMQEKTHSYNGVYFRVATARNHDRFQTTLPSGLVQMILLHHDAMPAKIESNSKYAYMIVEGDDTPEHFIDTLDKLIETPVLSKWEHYLWTIGRITGLVDFAGNPNDHVGCTVWRITKGKDDNAWSDNISAAIAAKELSICT